MSEYAGAGNVYYAKGPGGHEQDGSGPPEHGRGMGPGGGEGGCRLGPGRGGAPVLEASQTYQPKKRASLLEGMLE